MGLLCRTAGNNDAMDMTSVICRLEKMLKTGIVSSSVQSNVDCSTSFCSMKGISSDVTQKSSRPDKSFFPSAAEERLQELCTTPRQWLPNPEVASLALIGGYLARVVTEKVSCKDCVNLVEKLKGNAPVDGLIEYQDRGGLKYFTKELITVLIGLKRFVDINAVSQEGDCKTT